MTVLLRRCISCKVEKEATSEYFYKDKNRYLGLMYRCKECDKIRTSKQDRTNRYNLMTEIQKINKYKTYRIYIKTLKGRAIALLAAYKTEDLRKGREFSLTQQDLILAMSSSCVYCGYPATGVDRLNNKIGHTPDNCIPCCKECNISRMDNFSHKEMFIIGKAIREIKDSRNENKIPRDFSSGN